MTETRQRTFGGLFRQFCKDLGDMKDQTSSSSMEKKRKVQEDWQPIHTLEIRLVDAVMEIEDQYLFEYMQCTGFTTDFDECWISFRHLAQRWEAGDYLWKNLDELMQHRDWNGEHKTLKAAHHAFSSAKPRKYFHIVEKQPEWKEDYRASTSSKGATPETREPTFGGAFRKLIGDLEKMIYLIDQDILVKARKSDHEWQHIRCQNNVVKEAVKKVSSDELFKTMVAGLKNSRERFMDQWEHLEQLSSGWEKLLSNDNDAATHISDGGWERDRLMLLAIHRNIRWASPWGSKETDEWKNDYKADPNAIPEPRHLTFGGAWRKLKYDLLDIESLLSDSKMNTQGRSGDREYWKKLQDVEVRIRDNVPKFPQHPFFKHMIVPNMIVPRVFRSREKERPRFMLNWDKLEKLSQKWKDTSEVWNDTTQFIDTRSWKKDALLLEEIFEGFHCQNPGDFKDDLEWTEDFLPVSQMKDMEFI